MADWVYYSLLSNFFWGLWGFLSKLASRSVSSASLLIIAGIANLVMLPVYIYLFGKDFQFNFSNRDFTLAFLGSVMGSLGGLYYYWAIARGEASRVVAITSTYPLIVVVLAYFVLGESFTREKALGIIFCTIGVILLSIH